MSEDPEGFQNLQGLVHDYNAVSVIEKFYGRIRFDDCLTGFLNFISEFSGNSRIFFNKSEQRVFFICFLYFFTIFTAL